MKSIKSPARTSACLTASAVILSACGAGVVIPDSLRAPCRPTFNAETAETVGDLGKGIVQLDADIRVCSIQKDAVVAIAEANRPPRWQFWRR